jgi:hypothetical protein
MSLTSCRECSGQVSTEAPACPRCGAPQPWDPDWSGWGYEWRSKASVWGYPLVHVAWGRDRQGRRRVARGVVAVGQFAVGLVAVAQFGVGILFGLGQMVVGLTGIAQVAVALLFSVGQVAVGVVAVGQFALGWYALAQIGVARHLWSLESADPEAVAFFRRLAGALGLPGGR